MARILVFMAASLALGAAGMWASSHVKVRLTSDDAPAALPLAPPVTEPARLPASVTATIRDASVVQAAAEAQTKTAPDEIISLTDVTLIWDGATLNSEIKLTGDKVVLAYKATGLKLNQLKVSGKGEADFKSVADDTQKGQLSTTLTDNVAPPGTPVTFTIGRIDPLKPETIFTSSVTIRRPLKAEPAPFLITQKVNTVGAEFALVSTGVEVIGTYLRLKGRSSGGVLSGVTFSLLPTDNKPGAAVAVKSFTTANGDWECELTFPERRDGNTPTLLARGDFNGSHSYDPLRLAITFTALPISLAAPTLTVAKPNAPSVSLAPTSDSHLQVGGLPTYLSNVRGITVSVPAVAGARAVSLTLDAAAPDVKAAAALTVPTAPTVFAIPDVGAGRDHTFTATVAAGGLVSTAAQIAVRVMTVGPSVESVSAPGFGQSNGVGGERVAIRFSQANPLEPGTLAGKFAVVQRTTTNGVGNDLVGGTLPDFDPVTNTVTLSVSSVIPGSYFVRVAPGVTDVYGNNLVPAPGSTMPDRQ